MGRGQEVDNYFNNNTIQHVWVKNNEGKRKAETGMNKRVHLYMAIEQGSLAARDGYGYYEPVGKDRATSLILRINELEGEEEEVVVVDFSNLDRALIYQGVKRINEHNLPYFRVKEIRKKSPLVLGRGLIYEVTKEPERWLNIPEELKNKKSYQRTTSILVAELVFIGYKVFQSKITGSPVGNEVGLWLNDKEYLIGTATEAEREQGVSVYGYILRKQRSQPDNSIETEDVEIEPIEITELGNEEIAMFPLFSKGEAIEHVSRLRAAFFKGRGGNV